MSITTVDTLDEAIDVYAKWCEAEGLIFDQPANDSEYEPGRGWVLRNIRGELAVVRDDGSSGDLENED